MLVTIKDQPEQLPIRLGGQVNYYDINIDRIKFIKHPEQVGTSYYIEMIDGCSFHVDEDNYKKIKNAQTFNEIILDKINKFKFISKENNGHNS